MKMTHFSVSLCVLLLWAALETGYGQGPEFCGKPPPEGSCSSRLGLNVFRKTDVVITASSSMAGAGPGRAALFHTSDGGNADSWSASVIDENQWIQTDFGSPKTVTGVLLQGRGDVDEWVTNFRVTFSNDGVIFYSTPPIVGTFDRDTVARRYFDGPITARYIRINPIDSTGGVSLRFDLLGCDPVP